MATRRQQRQTIADLRTLKGVKNCLGDALRLVRIHINGELIEVRTKEEADEILDVYSDLLK